MELLQFTESVINSVPDSHGVYTLLRNGEVINIGRAAGAGVSIRSRLNDHRSGKENKGTERATHFRYRLSSIAEVAEIVELTEHMSHFGKLPRCNVQMPQVAKIL